MDIVGQLRCMACRGLVHVTDAVRVVQIDDYALGAREGYATVAEVVGRFDYWKCGLIDWRNLMLHLLLWCPVPMTINPTVREPTMAQLYEMKRDLGEIPLRRDEFDDVPLWFDGDVPAEQVEAIRDVLWAVVSNDANARGLIGESEVVNPTTLMLYLCTNHQRIRGVQLALCMSTPLSTEESSAITLDILHSVLHFSPCHAVACGVVDPYTVENLESLFTEARPRHIPRPREKEDDSMTLVSTLATPTLSFSDLCGMPIGRVVLNSIELFQRVSMLKDAKFEGVF